jgi:hypothetical protein
MSLRLLRIPLVRVRPVSTEALAKPAEATPLVKHIEQFVPIAIIFTFIGTIAGTAAYYKGELTRLEERMAGIMKEVDVKVSGTKEMIIKEVDAKMAGSEKTIDAKIEGFEKAADNKVRSLLPVCKSITVFFSHLNFNNPPSLSPHSIRLRDGFEEQRCACVS